MSAAEPMHAAARALSLAQGFHYTCRPGLRNLVYLLLRWRDFHAIPLTDRAINLIAAAVITAAPPAPVTALEVSSLIADLRAYFDPTTERQRMRSELKAYLTIRGASAEQMMRADVRLRESIGESGDTNIPQEIAA